MFHYIGGSVGSSPERDLNWIIFLLKIDGSKLLSRMTQASALCPIHPNLLQIIFFQNWITEITGWRVAESMLMKYEGSK